MSKALRTGQAAGVFHCFLQSWTLPFFKLVWSWFLTCFAHLYTRIKLLKPENCDKCLSQIKFPSPWNFVRMRMDAKKNCSLDPFSDCELVAKVKVNLCRCEEIDLTDVWTLSATFAIQKSIWHMNEFNFNHPRPRFARWPTTVAIKW